MATVDLCLLAGQSNASGVGDATKAPATNGAFCLDWNGSAFVALAEPNSTDSPYKPETGSSMPQFANTFTGASGRPLGIVRAARGGTSLLAANEIPPLQFGNGTWDTSGSQLLFPTSVSRLQAAISYLQGQGHTIGHVFVVWSQGGRDAQGGQNLHLYEAATVALIDRWRTATGISSLQIFMEETSSIQGGEGDLADELALIRAAQNAACESTPGLHMAFNEGKDFVNRPGYMRWDGIHYSQTGYNYMGLKMGTYAADYYGFTVEPETPPLEPTSNTSVAARFLQYAVPLPPLPRSFSTAGDTTYTVPFGVTSLQAEGEGAGGGGGGGGTLKGSAGGGGAYAKATFAVTPGEQLLIRVGAGGAAGTGTLAGNTPGGNGGTTEIIRVSDSTVLLRAVGGTGGPTNNPSADGAGGQAANCIGDVVTSGQNGGVSGIDNGGNGAAPLGGAGGIGPGPNAGSPPGGGGAGANGGSTQAGGAGAVGVVKLTKA